mmetsp:Transcript_64646/g.168125  ORF Transcript_64646/g.168125 Transcript_64646/m.168125 type:complete len:253 (-) Transcript_64646:534-1292(-)
METRPVALSALSCQPGPSPLSMGNLAENSLKKGLVSAGSLSPLTPTGLRRKNVISPPVALALENSSAKPSRKAVEFWRHRTLFALTMTSPFMIFASGCFWLWRATRPLLRILLTVTGNSLSDELSCHPRICPSEAVIVTDHSFWMGCTKRRCSSSVSGPSGMRPFRGRDCSNSWLTRSINVLEFFFHATLLTFRRVSPVCTMLARFALLKLSKTPCALIFSTVTGSASSEALRRHPSGFASFRLSATRNCFV